MRIIDEKGKLFGIVNLFDLFVVFAILIVAFAGYKYLSGRAIDGTKANVYFVVELRSVKKEFADKIKIGDEIKDSVKGYYLGKVSSVDIKPEVLTNWDSENNQFVKVESPEDYTVLVEILSNGTINNDTETVYAETVPVNVGKEMSIKGKGYAQTGYIVSITEDFGEGK